MASNRPVISSALALALTVTICGLATAQTAAPTKPAAKVAKKPAAKPVVAAYVPPDASAEQIEAADRVYYGQYDCEFNCAAQTPCNQPPSCAI